MSEEEGRGGGGGEAGGGRGGEAGGGGRGRGCWRLPEGDAAVGGGMGRVTRLVVTDIVTGKNGYDCDYCGLIW